MASQEQWQEISARAQQKVINDIPPEWILSKEKLPSDDQLDVTAFPASCGLLSSDELAITDTLATDLVAQLARGDLRAEDVTRAFCKRAAIAHQVVNCLTVVMFDAAIDRAKYLDLEFQRTGKTTGPLHGLPVSLKDNFNIPTFPSSVGFCSWAEEPMKEESTIVGMLLNLGAVLYVKTNVPTAMMIAETVNNCYGRTVNPQNRATTSGGSSGGESALIAMHGSPLGIGTDIGGSLRIPAACTGIFTLKPSFGRFPHFDARSGLAGQEAVASVHGPMARSIADLRLFAENVSGTGPWRKDPKCMNMPWRKVDLKAKPKIAVLWDNGIVHPTPPVHRALVEVVKKLKERGYEIVDWPVEDFKDALEILLGFFTADGGKSVRDILDPVKEPWRPEMNFYAQATDMGVHQLWQLQKRRTALCKRFLDRWEAHDGLDAILGPTTPYASTKNGEFRFVGYTGVFNILDYSSISFPTGVFVDKIKDTAYGESFEYFPPLGAMGDIDKQTQKEYDPGLLHGLPVSLQLTARRLQEEKILALAERLVQDLK